MRIAIYHNLRQGGALKYINSITKVLSPKNQIDMYCHEKLSKNQKLVNWFIYPLKEHTNIFRNLFFCLFDLKTTSKLIAKHINEKQYDLVIVGQCRYIQSPHILRYVNQKDTKVVYLFNEHLREFYEPTSFDYYTTRKKLSRLIRYPIKVIDVNNCQYAKTTISCSLYISEVLSKVYKKESIIILPGYKPIRDTIVTKRNNKNICSIGSISKLKGHDFSIKQVSTHNLNILGRITHDSKYIIEMTKKRKNIHIIQNESEVYKKTFLKKHTFYLANNCNEPFGISTLEAIASGCFIIGTNEGGTAEMVKQGLNGYLYSRNDMAKAKKILDYYLSKRFIKFHKYATIDWGYTTRQILKKSLIQAA